MAKVLEKRRYQERTVENFQKWFNTDGKLATIILPTGLGKTATASMCLDKVPGTRILWVAHREELIDQAHGALSDIVSWTNNIQKEIAEQKADPNSDIIVGSVQSISRKRKHLTGFTPDVVIIDEYHHRSENNKTYQGLFDRFPNAKFMGMTATPWRFSGDDLPLGEVLFEMDVGTAIAHNYLVPAIPKILKSNVSLANVKTQMGDFSTKELSQAVNIEERNKLIAEKVIELVRNDRQGILFGVDVAHAHDMYELLKNEIRAAEVYGYTPKEERRVLIEKIRNGEIDCLINNLVTVEGFDVPHLSFAAIARPTRSLGLYIQMVGRVLRTCSNKKDAIIIDVYDKMKIKQSRVTFNDMAYKGDMFGERKRANNILTADIEWKQPDFPGGGKPDAVADHIAKALKNFPVFMINDDQGRWTTDDNFMPITSWVISDDQRLITWTEEKLIDKLVDKATWVPMTIKPTRAAIKAMPIKVKHSKFGEGTLVDVGFGLELKVTFGDGWMSGRSEFVSIADLSVKHIMQEMSEIKDKIKTDRVFYLCFPCGTDKGRLVEMVKVKKDLIVQKDERMTRDEARKYLIDKAHSSGVLPLVRSDAQWKKYPISESQYNLLENWVLGGKIRFDLDLKNINKGDASAIIEQVKWQNIINEKFGTTSKSKLLGYDSSAEEV